MERRVGNGLAAGRPNAKEPSFVGRRREFRVRRDRFVVGCRCRDEGVRGGHERQLGREEEQQQQQRQRQAPRQQ